MIRAWLRRHQWIPEPGMSWAQHSQRLRTEMEQRVMDGITKTPPETETVEEVPTETPGLSKADRQLLRKKFRIPAGVPDPKWFEYIEEVK